MYGCVPIVTDGIRGIGIVAVILFARCQFRIAAGKRKNNESEHDQSQDRFHDAPHIVVAI